MNRTKIEWCNYTWNPVTGCLHNCPYCYARGIAQRFGTRAVDTVKIDAFLDVDYAGRKYDFATLGKAYTLNGKIQPFPYGFHPTFHRYRLDEPQKVKTPQNIFVCSMADLFGEWVPDEWIEEVFHACERAPQHRYLFLTKNPSRYGCALIFQKYYLRANFYFGETVTNNNDLVMSCMVSPKGTHRFLSIEPLQENLDYTLLRCRMDNFCWVVIGAESGTGKGKVIPKREWIKSIVDYCQISAIPVFMKNSLAPIWNEPLIREFPVGLQCHGQ